MDADRRNSPRYPFIADAEVTEPASGTRLRARTSDLSLGGCFLDMLNPIPEGTLVQVRIYHADETFEAQGRVAFVAPNMGMGVAFTRKEDPQDRLLRKWLAGSDA